MKKRLVASTLLEVLIAMVIIMVVFTIALKVFNNVMNSSLSFKKVAVQGRLSLLMEAAKEVNNVAHSEEIEGVVYTYELLPTEQVKVSKLKISAAENGKLIGSVRCFVKNDWPNED